MLLDDSDALTAAESNLEVVKSDEEPEAGLCDCGKYNMVHEEVLPKASLTGALEVYQVWPDVNGLRCVDHIDEHVDEYGDELPHKVSLWNQNLVKTELYQKHNNWEEQGDQENVESSSCKILVWGVIKVWITCLVVC